MATTLREAHVSHTKPHDEKKSSEIHEGKKEDSPRLPHDRDESSFDKERAEPDAMIKQAFDDIQDGQLDTDRRGIPGVEEVERSKANHAQEDIPESSRIPPSTPRNNTPTK
jgi:hypothetical protein